MGLYEDKDYIERDVKVGNKKITARYYPKSGRFGFGVKVGAEFRCTERTNVGAFATLTALIKTFRDINPDKITYDAYGSTKKEAELKDKFYARALKRLGYKEQPSLNKFKKPWLSYTWHSPIRTWIKINKSLEGSLVTSIVGIISGLFFLSSNITGNAIANITNSTLNFIGALLITAGLIAGFFWIRNT